MTLWQHRNMALKQCGSMTLRHRRNMALKKFGSLTLEQCLNMTFEQCVNMTLKQHRSLMLGQWRNMTFVKTMWESDMETVLNCDVETMWKSNIGNMLKLWRNKYNVFSMLFQHAYLTFFQRCFYVFCPLEMFKIYSHPDLVLLNPSLRPSGHVWRGGIL